MSSSIISWNVNGIRSNVIPYLENFVEIYNIDFVCLQETKLTEESFLKIKLKGYIPHFSISKNKQKARQAYAGVAIFVKESLKDKILSVSYNILDDVHIDEGRFLSIELEDFIVATVYVPNSGTNKDFRKNVWHPIIKKWTTSIKKKLILTGDFNSITTPYDVWWAKQPESARKIDDKIYHQKVMEQRKDSPGVMPYEIEALKDLKESAGLIDLWKHVNPTKIYDGFTWFNTRTKSARRCNKGWRIDYIFINFQPPKNVECEVVESETESSDHAPLYALI